MATLTRRLDPSTNDMTFGQGLANYADKAEACAQNVRTRHQLLYQEWFLDTSVGLPYLQNIMTRPSDILLAESLVKKCILGTEGVSSITKFNMTFDHETRILAIQASVQTIYGDVLNIKVTK